MVKHVMVGGDLSGGLAEVLLVLISKIEQPSSIIHFCPISLRNVLYKIITKLIINWMKEVLGDLIAPSQSRFIPGHQMVDNIIICQELLHTAQRKQGNKGAMALKLDLAKAYDRLEWAFIQDTMVDAGLPLQLGDVIMKCITCGYCRVLWNGEATDPIYPSWGLLKDYPRSSYLFVLYMGPNGLNLRRGPLNGNHSKHQEVYQVSHIFSLRMMFFYSLKQQKTKWN